MGIQVFSNVHEARRAGFMIEPAYPDSEGFPHARFRTADGWARALARRGAR